MTAPAAAAADKRVPARNAFLLAVERRRVAKLRLRRCLTPERTQIAWLRTALSGQ
jgi:hypothetical protein